MKVLREKLKSILVQAGANSEEIGLWERSFLYLDPAEVPDFLETLAKIPKEEIRFYTDLLKFKLEALERKDKSLWENTLKKEEEYIQNV